MAMSMQGSGISNVDVGSATIKLNEDGTYLLSIGAADMGTGCDTTLAQVAAECLECDTDRIAVSGCRYRYFTLRFRDLTHPVRHTLPVKPWKRLHFI